MTRTRHITRETQGFPAVDGGGVSLIRVLGNTTADLHDPILMLDSFDSTNPLDYRAGFPMHPHRGIETVSYLRNGKIRHRDSLGFDDTITDGEVQWMCAGSGILHEELIPDSDRLLGVQLWLNLPQANKMCKPHYYAIKNSQIEEIPIKGGDIRLLSGNYTDAQGVVHKGHQGQNLPLDYYDVGLNPGASTTIAVDPSRTVIAFTLLGSAVICGELVPEKTAVLLEDGDEVTIAAANERAQVLFISSIPLDEPVAWGGPIVMNTQQELMSAFHELDNGTFLKDHMAID